jgi:type I restriction enzyme S subunit
MSTPMWTTFSVVDKRAGILAEELPLLSVSQYRGVVPRSELTDKEARADDLSIYKVCQAGDVILNRMSAYNGAVGEAKVPGLISPDYLVMRPTVAADATFLTYLIKTSWFVGEMSSRVRGIGSIDGGNVRTPRIGAKELGSIKVDLPPVEQQRVIVAFLDRETAEIDAFIAEQGALVELLNERRSATITQSITKGLVPTAPMKDSRVEWLGKVPEAWHVSRLARYFDVVLGKMLDAGKEVHPDANMLPYIRAANIQDAGLDLSDVKSMPFTAAEAANLSIRSGDLLVVEGGSIGTSHLVPCDMDGWSFQKTVNRVRSKGVSRTSFLQYVLRSSRDSNVLGTLCNGSTIAHLTAEKLLNLVVPIPSPQEQQEIVDYLDRETTEIDAAIADAKEAIELSKERRAALISAAVTGKIDVRNRITAELGAA